MSKCKVCSDINRSLSLFSSGSKQKNQRLPVHPREIVGICLENDFTTEVRCCFTYARRYFAPSVKLAVKHWPNKYVFTSYFPQSLLPNFQQCLSSKQWGKLHWYPDIIDDEKDQAAWGTQRPCLSSSVWCKVEQNSQANIVLQSVIRVAWTLVTKNPAVHEKDVRYFSERYTLFTHSVH